MLRRQQYGGFHSISNSNPQQNQNGNNRLWIWAAAQLVLVTVFTTYKMGSVRLVVDHSPVLRSLERTRHQMKAIEKQIEDKILEFDAKKATMIEEYEQRMQDLRQEKLKLKTEHQTRVSLLKNEWMQLKVQNRQLVAELSKEEKELHDLEIHNETVTRVAPLTPEGRQNLYEQLMAIEGRPKPEPRPIHRSTCLKRSVKVPQYDTVQVVTKGAQADIGLDLAVMSGAGYVAQKMGAGLTGYWDCCGAENIFEHLFGPEPLLLNGDEMKDETVTLAQKMNETFMAEVQGNFRHLQFRRDLAGFDKYRDLSLEDRCHEASEDRWQSDYNLFMNMEQRYHLRSTVHDYVKKHFEGMTSIGIHLHTTLDGKGFFARKSDDDRREWVVEYLAPKVLELKRQAKHKVVAFVAADDPSYVDYLREVLKKHMRVFDLPEIRLLRDDEMEDLKLIQGRIKTDAQTEHCLDGWDSTFQDLLLLSHTDMLLTVTPGSYSQSMPMAMVLQRPDKKEEGQYCEMHKVGQGLDNEMKCFKSLKEWHCKEELGHSDLYYELGKQYRVPEMAQIA